MMELQYNKSLEIYRTLNEHILDKLFLYDEKLITIPDAVSIKIYAKETVNNLILININHKILLQTYNKKQVL